METKAIRFEVNGINCFTEEDIHEKGCIPNSGTFFTLEEHLKADSIEELIQLIHRAIFVDYNKENILLNSCDEEGRIDIQCMNDVDNSEASKSDIALWKLGKKRLWAACYTARIERVTREAVSLVVEKL